MSICASLLSMSGNSQHNLTALDAGLDPPMCCGCFLERKDIVNRDFEQILFVKLDQFTKIFPAWFGKHHFAAFRSELCGQAQQKSGDFGYLQIQRHSAHRCRRSVSISLLCKILCSARFST